MNACAKCKKSFSSLKIADFPTNFDLIAAIKNKSEPNQSKEEPIKKNQEKCKKHN